MASYQNGGWYVNPDTGVSQRYLNGGFLPVGQVEPGVYLAGQGPASGGGAPSVPSFSYDYAGEAQKAYGELGDYYGKLLADSKGDLNLALARLAEDYDRGVRIKTEDTTTNKQTNDLNRQNAARQVLNNALSRGIYQGSAGEPGGGKGIYDTNINRSNDVYDRNAQALDLGLQRYKEQADIDKSRKTVDLNTSETRYEDDLEQQRRKEAADIANQRGQQAYAKFEAGLF